MVPVRVPFKSFMEAIPRGSVFIMVSFTVINGHVRLPHCWIKLKIARRLNWGTVMGSTILKKVP